MKLEQGIQLEQALQAFDFGGEIVGAARYGGGHINDTFAVYVQQPDGNSKRYILQRINTDIFKKPYELMENILNVTEYLKKIIIKNGGDPLRETLTVMKTKSGNACFTDSEQGVWRCLLFVENTLCLEKVEKDEHFYNAAKSFGNFLRLLENYPADTLHESIEKFHDTRNRYANFEKAVAENKADRAANVQAEIDFVRARKEDCAYLMDLLERGMLPLRVTHNDTKINNILIDEATGEGLCIIDLDTIMPGLCLNDFGDSIRFGATTALEDEADLSKVHFDMHLYEIYTKGYLEAAGEALTVMEKACLPWGAKLMTLECGIRFLTDYLDGDTYFKIHRPGQNLDRARNQFKLVQDMEEKWTEMQAVVKKYSN
ncbi:MAG: aminoglycoside phosphotransferase family protein [Oscillospiraceae bacterium]|nr:aminoglycoside phosphotransferase family protein [Oscillospiraceae bacterium]